MSNHLKYLPHHKSYKDLSAAERIYFESLAKSEAEKLLRHVSGSSDFKKLVAAHLGVNMAPVENGQ